MSFLIEAYGLTENNTTIAVIARDGLRGKCLTVEKIRLDLYVVGVERLEGVFGARMS